jgi:hypothetical protein
MAGQPATNGAGSDAAFGGDEYLGWPITQMDGRPISFQNNNNNNFL